MNYVRMKAVFSRQPNDDMQEMKITATLITMGCTEDNGG